MPPSRGSAVITAAHWSAGLLVAACGGADVTPEAGPFDVAVGPAATVVSLESELLGNPTDMVVAEDGSIWIADSQSKRILVVQPDGSDPRFYGVEGEGPGEFRAPSAIAVRGDTVRVFDARNSRVQLYRRDGTHLSDRVVATVIIGVTSLGPDGRLIAPTMGRDSALAATYSPSDNSRVLLGPNVVPPPTVFMMRSMKERIAAGTVPDEFRNIVTGTAASTGGAWLLVQTEAEVRRYGPAGTLEWSRTMAVPEIEGARSEFFEKNAALTDPMRIFPLTTMSDAAEVAGHLWLLMQTPEGTPAAIYVLDGQTGATLGRLTAALSAPARGIAVDAHRRRLYLAIPDEASVVAVDVSGVPVWNGS